MPKINLIESLIGERNEINRLFDLGDSKTESGQVQFTSSTSSITYDTTGTDWDNQGERGMMLLLQDALKDYIWSADDANQIGDLSTLNTSVKTDLVNGINSHLADFASYQEYICFTEIRGIRRLI